MPRRVLGLLLLALLLWGAGLAQPPPSREQLEEQISAFEELLNVRAAELERLASELSTTNAELDALLAERERLSSRIVTLSDARAGIRAQVETLRQRQRLSARRIAGLEAQTGALQGQLQDLIVSLHKRRGGSNVGALSQSESLFDLRVKNYYLARLTEQDVTLLETFNRATRDLGRARTQRAQRVRALGARARELNANQLALTTTQTELETVIANLSASRAGQMAEREVLLREQGSIEDDLTGARGQLAAELERRQEEAARLAAQEAAETSTVTDDAFAEEAARLERLIRGLNDPTPETERAFALPFPDPVVIRAYGEDGATDVWLRAPQPGSAVRAVKSGVVYRASLITANSGYTVAVQHGSSLISAYTNLQAPVVEAGDRVQQGDILGYLGGGIVDPDILQFRLGRPQGLDIIYQDPVPLLGLGAG